MNHREENSALLIIDVQNDYFSGGRMALPGAEETAANIGRVLEHCRENRIDVYHIQHESVREGSTFFLPGTDGQEIHSSVAPQQGESVILKHFPNSFLKTDLLQQLRDSKTESLIITGMMTFMCVDATTRAAVDLGFSCTLLHDCTTTPPTEFNGVGSSFEQAKSTILAALSHLCTRICSAEQFITDGGQD